MCYYDVLKLYENIFTGWVLINKEYICYVEYLISIRASTEKPKPSEVEFLELLFCFGSKQSSVWVPLSFFYKGNLAHLGLLCYFFLLL